jgi:hypothetical protein
MVGAGAATLPAGRDAHQAGGAGKDVRPAGVRGDGADFAGPASLPVVPQWGRAEQGDKTTEAAGIGRSFMSTTWELSPAVGCWSQDSWGRWSWCQQQCSSTHGLGASRRRWRVLSGGGGVIAAAASPSGRCSESPFVRTHAGRYPTCICPDGSLSGVRPARWRCTCGAD